VANDADVVGAEFIDENGSGPGVRLRKSLRAKPKYPK
jgi:hypothetical protein